MENFTRVNDVLAASSFLIHELPQLNDDALFDIGICLHTPKDGYGESITYRHNKTKEIVTLYSFCEVYRIGGHNKASKAAAELKDYLLSLGK